jgi:hypothetical protein
MNTENRPPRRLPDQLDTGKLNSRCGGQRAWAREVRTFSDAELILCVRAQVAVDEAVNTYRQAAAAPYSFDVPT